MVTGQDERAKWWADLRGEIARQNKERSSEVQKLMGGIRGEPFPGRKETSELPEKVEEKGPEGPLEWKPFKVKVGEERKKQRDNVPVSFQARWQMEKERDKGGYDEVIYKAGGGSQRAPTGTEVLALQKMAQNKGMKVDYRNLAHQLGYGSHYMSIVLRGLGNADYIDFRASGMCVLTDKGKEHLKKKDLLPEEEPAEKRREKNILKEREMLEKLVQLMAGDGIFDKNGGEKDWALGRVRCFINRALYGWDLIVIALEKSNFILRWGWEDLLDVYLVQLHERLNLVDYYRINREEIEALPKIKEFLGEKNAL